MSEWRLSDLAGGSVGQIGLRLMVAPGSVVFCGDVVRGFSAEIGPSGLILQAFKIFSPLPRLGNFAALEAANLPSNR